MEKKGATKKVRSERATDTSRLPDSEHSDEGGSKIVPIGIRMTKEQHNQLRIILNMRQLFDDDSRLSMNSLLLEAVDLVIEQYREKGLFKRYESAR